MAAPPPLPLSAAVSVEKKKKKHALAGAPFLLPSVRDVINWALLHAGCVAIAVVYALIVTSIYISHPPAVPSWLLPLPAGPEPEEMTDAAADVSLMVGVLWFVCVVSQAAAGALALLALPRHRVLLGYAALVATAAGHCMWAGLYIMLFVAPGRFTFWYGVSTVAVLFCGVGDLLCFLGLILRGGEE